MRRKFDDSYIWTLAMLLLATSAAAAVGLHPLADVQRAAESAAERAVPISSGTLHARAAELDPRLALARCDAPLRAQTAPPRSGTMRMMVSVQCPGPSHWTINVPVGIEVEQPVLVVRRPIARGAVISAREISVERRRLPGLTSRYLASVADLEHKTARRPLAIGEVLTSDAVVPAIIVKRGQSINLVAESGGVAIRATGRAMADAALQGRIRVQNANSLTIIEGIVESADTVRVGR